MKRMTRSTLAGCTLSMILLGACVPEPSEGQVQPMTEVAMDAIMAVALGDYAQALRVWRPMAEQGDPAAQLNLGLAYLLGRGVSADENEAVAWFRKAADQGFAPAQSSLAQYYGSFVDGERRDLKRALEWFRKAADQGFAPAEYAMCTSYLGNDLTVKDDVLALKWCQLAGEQGHTRAQHELGQIYGEGRGVPVDKVKALSWLQRAAEKRVGRGARRHRAVGWARSLHRNAERLPQPC